MIALLLASCSGNQSKTNKETTMTTVKDPHTFAQPDEAVVNHLSLDLTVDFNKKTLSGTATLSYSAKKEAKQLIVDTRGLTIDSVNAGKDSLHYQLETADEFLGQALAIDLPSQQQPITIHYSTSPDAAALQWLTPEQTAGKKFPFFFTQSQAILARTWVPVQDSPGIRFTYDAVIHVPKELLALMSAENPQQKNDTGIYHFKMPQPVPAYLLALAVGDVTFQSFDDRTGVYAEPVTIEKAHNEFIDLPKMVDAAENLYGPYAWGRYDLIVLPPSFPFGGMENPRLTFATPTILAGDRSLVSLVAHELAHSWSGNLVTNATWNDFWMNEGFTVYFENRIMEAVYGKDFAEMQTMLGYEDLQETIQELGDTSKDTHLKLDLAGRDPDDGMNQIAYEKGHFLLLLIEKNIGREKFDAFLKNYFSRHSFKTITTEEFIKEYNEEIIKGDQSLANRIRIEEWIYKPGLPDNCPHVTSAKFEAVEKQVEAFKNGTAAGQLQTKNYTANEWLRFLRALPGKMSTEQMKSLDYTFHFTTSGNSEILFVWLTHVIANQYEPAYPALRSFLNEVGRRKFVKPLFAALVKNPSGLAFAEEIYLSSRNNYHFITQQTIDEIFAKAKKKQVGQFL